jgi:hypothetical protein
MSNPSFRPSRISNHAGTPRSELTRVKSLKSAWHGAMGELEAHKSQGIEVEPIRRAKIADRLQRDHHRSERTSGKTRAIIKGRVG